MPAVLQCLSKHEWTDPGPCPECGGAAVATDAPGGTVPATDRPAAARLPSIPGYELHAEIGGGGMGVVYRATQRSLNRQVALKVIRAGELANPSDRKRFETEAEVVAKLQHPNIVQVFDVGVAESGPFYTMQLFGADTLEKRLAAGQLPFRDAALLLETLARAVQHAHAHGVVHRDLKPSNVLFADDGTPKLVDFGVAKKLSSDDGLTETGKPIGTPGYMAPEQAAGRKEIGPGTDVYALGVVLYEMLSGRVPFDEGTLYDKLHAIINVDPVSPAWYRTDVPRDLETICLKCLRKKPADRYPTAAALADDLDRYLTDRPITAGRTLAWDRLAKRLRRPLPPVVTLAAIAVVLVAAVVATVLFQGRTPTPPTETTAPTATPDPTPDPALELRRAEMTRKANLVLGKKPEPDTASAHQRFAVAELGPPSFEAFEELLDERVYDLRGWRPARDGEAHSYVVYQNTRKMFKVADTDKYQREMLIPAKDIFTRGYGPTADKWKVYVADKPGRFGGQDVTVRQVVLDVSDIPRQQEFEVQFQTTFVDSHQRVEDQWLAMMGHKGALRASQLIIFPEGRPFKSYQLRVFPRRDTGAEPPVPYAGKGTVLEGDGNRWLFWEVIKPETGRAYRVDWTW